MITGTTLILGFVSIITIMIGLIALILFTLEYTTEKQINR